MRRFLIAALMVPTIAFAGAPAGMEKVGSAQLRKLMLHVYDAALYAPGGKYDADKKHALELTYRMNFDSEEIVDRSLDEIRHAQSVSAEQAKTWRKELSDVIPNVKDGDSITAVATPGKSIAFSHNGKATGIITDKTLVEPFMGIWLGSKTSEPAMRKKLLGS